MANQKGVWLLDPRFDFLVPGFQKRFQIASEDLTFIGSYHGPTRVGRHAVTIGDTETGHVVFMEPEELNRRCANMLKRKPPDAVAAFTGAYLPDDLDFKSVLATGAVCVRANHKLWQYHFFRRLGIPTPKTWSADRITTLQALLPEILSECKKVVVKPPELSGGYQMAVLSSCAEAEDYLSAFPGDSARMFLLSEYIPHTQSFAGMGVIARDGSVRWCGATEQVLYRDLAYEGLIYPPFAEPETLREMERLTLLTGRELAAEGYYGFFNVDYILGDQGLQAVEINARFGFGTLLYACFCADGFWDAVQGVPVPETRPKKRVILGKFKGRPGRRYEGLTSESGILQWYRSGKGRFRTFFCGTAQPEIFEYGSFIGLFGTFLPLSRSRDAVLKEFWKDCLAFY